jgi:hypothetical protein
MNEETVYIYKHKSSGRFACTYPDALGGIHFSYSSVLPHSAWFYTNYKLCKDDLLNSVDKNGDRYARENFLEFTLCKYRVALQLIFEDAN